MPDTNLSILEIAMELAFPPAFLEQIAQRSGAERAREAAMSTSVGGIGPLLKDRIFGQAAIGINVTGVSLLYDRVWTQGWQEWGQLILQKREIASTLKKFLTATDLGFEMPLWSGEMVKVDVYQLMYGTSPVYFLSCPPITDVVYPGPKDAPAGTANLSQWSHEFRLKQGWVLGRGALHLMKKLGQKPETIVLSETPTLFGHHRIVKDPLQNDPFFAETRYVFNDHTPLEYAHPIWDQHTLDLIGLNPDLYLNSPAWNPARRTLDVTSLLVGTCDGVYGVAKKHGDVMRAMPSLKPFAEKISSITNGVKKEDWQADELSDITSLTDEELIRRKQLLKKRLLDWAWRRCRLFPSWAEKTLDRYVCVLTRRITPYKRLDVLLDLLKNKDMRDRFLSLNVAVFVGGRIHQVDNQAQDIVYDLLDLVEKDETLRERIVFIDNFNIWEAPILYKGADGSIMMADDTREASATGFMKAQMNGAAVLATPDGAIPEFVFFDETNPAKNGFIIPYLKGEPTPLGLLEAFVAFEKSMRSPEERAKMIRAAWAVTPQIDIARTSQEMKNFFESLRAPVSARS